MKPTILVPTDFTDAANTALRHAIQTAKHASANMIIIHFCDSQKDIVSAKKKLAEWVSTIDNKTEINQIVRVGDFKEISNIGKELDVELIFMGTHGAKGLQKILGSNALKLVTDSQTPFIIVQKNSPVPMLDGYKTILATVSHNRESKQKVQAVAAIAKYFNSRVILLYRDEKDENLRIDASTNLVFMRRHLDKAGITYKLTLSKGKNFNEDTIRIAKQHKVDLITIMNMQMNTVLGTGVFGSNYEQELIMNNEHIPIMIVSPNKSGRLGNVTLM